MRTCLAKIVLCQRTQIEIKLTLAVLATGLNQFSLAAVACPT